MEQKYRCSYIVTCVVMTGKEKENTRITVIIAFHQCMVIPCSICYIPAVIHPIHWTHIQSLDTSTDILTNLIQLSSVWLVCLYFSVCLA